MNRSYAAALRRGSSRRVWATVDARGSRDNGESRAAGIGNSARSFGDTGDTLEVDAALQAPGSTSRGMVHVPVVISSASISEAER